MGGGRTERACEKTREEARKERRGCWSGLLCWCKGVPKTNGNGWKQKREELLLCEGGGVRHAGASWHPRAHASDDPRTGEELRSDAGSVGKERRGMMQRSVEVGLLDEVGRGGRGRGAANKHRGNGDGLGELSNVRRIAKGDGRMKVG